MREVAAMALLTAVSLAPSPARPIHLALLSLPLQHPSSISSRAVRDDSECEKAHGVRLCVGAGVATKWPGVRAVASVRAY